jgi:hypothetical protein
VVSLKAYQAIAWDVCEVEDPVHAIELGVPLTDLGDTRFSGRTVILPGLDVQLAKDIGRNGIDVCGRDAVGGEKGLDWSGHCMKFKKVWAKLIRFSPVHINGRRS